MNASFHLPANGTRTRVILMTFGEEVHDHETARVRVVTLAQPGKDVVGGIMGDHPFKSRLVAVHLVQRRHGAIEVVEIADQVLDAGVPLLPQQVPIERMIVIPFALLAEFAAHEQELLARMAEHEAVIGAQVCKTLPFIARHAAEDARHDFVMRQRQNEILRKRSAARTGCRRDGACGTPDLWPMYSRVVHPSHVPFEAEPSPPYSTGCETAARRSILRGGGRLRNARTVRC